MITIRQNPLSYLHIFFIMLTLIILGFLPHPAISENIHPITPAQNGTAATIYTLDLVKKNTFPVLVPQYEIRRPKIGLALSGGGLRGIAQIGVLKALEDNGIPIDYIVGTSIGAVVGGLYAAGYTPEELWQAISRLQLDRLLSDSPSRAGQFLAQKEKRGRAILQVRVADLKFSLPGAYSPGHHVTETLTDLLLNAPINAFTFSKLRVPLRIVTTDLLSGKKIILADGNLIDAMRASIAIPLLLSPVEYDSLLLVDGGLLDNMPVDETRAFGADIIIAINCTANLREKGNFDAPWEMADQVTTIMQKEHNLSQLQKADIVLDFQDFSSSATDEQSMITLYQEGQNRAQMLIPQIRSLLLNEKDHDDTSLYTFVDYVVLPESETFFGDFTKEKTAGRFIGKTEILKTLGKIYSSGYIKHAHAEIRQDSSNKATLFYHIEEFPVLNQVVFYGNHMVPDSLLLKPFASLLGKTLNTETSRAALNNIIKIYRTLGYSLAEINNIHYDQQAGAAHIFISEGIIAAVNFLGNRVTRDFALHREFPLKSGDIFRMGEAKTGISNLFGTGLFYAVNLAASREGDKWKINIKLQEKEYAVIRLGIHYDEERYGRSFIEISNENLFGAANDITLHGLSGTRDNRFYLHFNTNRIFKSYITGHINIHYQTGKHYCYENLNNTGEYERRSAGLSVGMGMQMARFGALSAIMRLERIQTQNISATPIEPATFSIQTLGISSIVDTRNQVPFPFSGKYHKFLYEVASGKLLGSKISYFKVQSQLSTHWTIRRRNTFSPKLLWGTSDLITPYSEQYRIGGEETFYGLREGELVGKNMLIASMEYRYWIPWNRFFEFFMSLRLDFGAVWKNHIKVQGEDFISGKGVSFSVKTPFGPISLSYGTASRKLHRLYFSAGYDF